MYSRGFAPLFVIIFGLVAIIATGVYVVSQNTDEGSDAPIKVTEEVGTEESIESTSTIEEQNVPEGETSPSSAESPILPSVGAVKEPSYLPELNELERVISILYEVGNIIGQSHYEDLSQGLDNVESQTKAQTDHNLIGALQEKLKSLLPLPSETITSSNENTTQQNPPVPEEPTCLSNPSPIFTSHITDMSRIVQITPPGTIFADGTVKSHSYLWNKDSNQVPLYAPADMTLASGAHYIEGGISQYLLYFQVSCEVGVKFDHVFFPIDAIRNVFPQDPKSDTRTNPPSEAVSFSAGDVIGYTPGNPASHNWDFGVYNTTIYPNPVTEGVANLEEVDKRADCAYDYFTPTLRQVYKDLFITEIGGSTQSIPYCTN